MHKLYYKEHPSRSVSEMFHSLANEWGGGGESAQAEKGEGRFLVGFLIPELFQTCDFLDMNFSSGTARVN